MLKLDLTKTIGAVTEDDWGTWHPMPNWLCSQR